MLRPRNRRIPQARIIGPAAASILIAASALASAAQPAADAPATASASVAASGTPGTPAVADPYLAG
ncbi:hypothetical protein, partial [Pantoea agglomerans]|uniref:hypothetical protein n=2 Tax=Pseudomonadota TaxID=1224 RepID=UPI001CA44F8F